MGIPRKVVPRRDSRHSEIVGRPPDRPMGPTAGLNERLNPGDLRSARVGRVRRPAADGVFLPFGRDDT